MNYTLCDSEPMINMKQITDVEKILGNKLPGDYIKFLLSHNGGRPVPNTFQYLYNNENVESDIAWLYSISSSEYENLLKETLYFRNRKLILRSFVLIGRNSGSDQICLSTNDDDYGSVYIWHHDVTQHNDMIFIANSFNKFLNIIR